MSEPIWLNIGPGQFSAPKPWINVDLHQDPPGTENGTFPDVVVKVGEYPFENVDRVMYGHLLEHMGAEHCLDFLRGWGSTLKTGAEVFVIGPDVNRSLALYKSHELKLDDLWQRMEPGAHRSEVSFWVDYYERELYNWPGYHRMNCTPERAHALLQIAGYQNIQEIDILSTEVGRWPVVSRSHDQFVLTATAP